MLTVKTDSGIETPRPISIRHQSTTTRLDEAARREDSSARAMIGIASLPPKPEIKTLAMIAVLTTTIEGMNTKDPALHMTISTGLHHVLRTRVMTGVVVGTESAIEAANGIDTIATEIDILNDRLGHGARRLTSTAAETSEAGIDLSEKATLTDTIHGHCDMMMLM